MILSSDLIKTIYNRADSVVTPYNIMPWVYISEKTQSNVILRETKVGL